MKIVVLALIGALIGYVTNVLAIKLLFRPIEPSWFFKIQGLIPKRREEIAVTIGEVVEEELLSMEEIIDEVVEKTDKEEILNVIKKKILEIIKSKFIMYNMFASVIESTMDDIFEKEGEKLLNEMTEKMIHKLANSISIKEMVREKLLKLDLLELEEIIIKIAKKELKHIELLGGVLGLVIGVIQGVIVTLM